MHTTYLRDLFHLHRGKIALFFLALAFAPALSAQRYSSGNYNYYDFQQKDYYFGITLGYNTSSFKPFRSKGFLESD
ncbi:MAG TPA: PorT family protein, partial [Saprospiraceae bacterium]|nr:PorT family protein [Saprospiraceae bacterium]